MSDTTDVTSDVSNVADDATTTGTRRRRGSGLSAMLLPELQSLAASLGISGTARMRKGELITAISERQNGAAAGSTPRPRAESEAKAPETAPAPSGAPAGTASAPATAGVAAAPAAAGIAVATIEAPAATVAAEGGQRSRRTRATASASTSAPAEPKVDGDDDSRGDRDSRGERDTRDRGDRHERGERTDERSSRNDRGDRGGDRGDRNDRSERNDRGQRDGRRGDGHGDGRQRDNQPAGQRDGGRDLDGDDDDESGGRRSRRSRFRDRRRGRGERGEGDDRSGAREGGGREGRDPQVSDDDVLVPVAGIVDVLDNYAFVRTTGYLSGPNDVYVSMSQVKKYGLRRGDAVTGAVRQAREGEQRRDKYNPLVRLDTVNGMDPEEAKRRPEFYKLTPLYPQERLRLETEPHILTTRVIDLIMPIGKGQRALIVSPPKAGKTMIQQAVANAITRNHPEVHLMVVLIDERPEEVTDMQRSVKGEVISSTFDRPPQDHTTVAELAIERAKRLVELGHDVVVLLDSITRLGRAYNLAAPASGRILSGGIDSTALYPPKRFLGAARNIENGGSLTIIANALVETGSMMDTVIFEEFKGTGNAELKLDRKIADKRVFPAIDIHPSSTRKEEILLAPEELAITHKLRKVLHSLESQAALDLLLDRLKQSRTNIEFLRQIAKSTPGE
ncbi:transcription termination factor Rho [Asanoa hainanensis]|uniref:Transcription termination factor Rho n=1 Tax=Asanoa hainanensis TaxID=560556 RepID=A0A239JWX9_9ACTN|nr:transcription termination factor Rho [Asanoa hainanensis]SNT09992.1 transcription termination factor Rho [Asanoa hainanensis]